MKTINRILGVLWMVVFGFFCVSFSIGAYLAPTIDKYASASKSLFCAFLYLVGTVAAFKVFRGNSRTSQLIVSVLAFLTATASMVGMFAFFNLRPYSFAGIGLDVFAIVSAGILFFVRTK